ncbi:hypothetical protein MATL_G00154830 [Megalops atlanticus]|uniref:EGF-like domain-containing protein n=1 Tax=Megalops atlanticus TaxID=7932 RepID=A0A9D3PV09_MEGAT|nr:hypothetical protein MATL_G00154830 [Megalops atlanticus]
METCSVIQTARLVLIVLLIILNAVSIGTFTVSIDTDRTAMMESYFPLNTTDLEKNTALPTELTSSAPPSSRGTDAEWGNSASTEIADSLSGFSKEERPPTEANSATEVNANTGVSTDTESWESPSQPDSTYTSSTLSRAGERTLLSVTTNSTAPYFDNTSPYLDKSSPYSNDPSHSSKNPSPYSHNPSHYTDNPSPYSEDSNSSETYSQSFTREGQSRSTPDRVSTDGATSSGFTQSGATSGSIPHFPTNTSQSAPPETGSPPDISQQSFGTVADGTQNSTPPLTVTNSGGREGTEATDSAHTTGARTSQAGTSHSGTSLPVSLGPPSPPEEDQATETSRPEKESTVTSVSAAGTTTESSTGAFRTTAIDHTENTKPLDRDSNASLASSTAPLVGKDEFTATEDPQTEFSSRQQPSTTEADQLAGSTESPTTTPGTVTQRTQFTERDAYRATSSTAMPAVTTSPYKPSPTTEAPTPPTTPIPAQTTPAPQATPSTSQRLPPPRTGGPASRSHSTTVTSAVSTDVTTLHLETSTATPGKTTHRSGHTTVSYSATAPTRTTPAHTTWNHTERATTSAAATTVQMHVRSTVAPVSPCDPNPCGNGGTCVVERENSHRCVCLPSWTGSDCSEDVDECVSGPCPSSARCVNTRGSFSCECPLGYDLEHGRACTRARTFLGMFQVTHRQLNATHPRTVNLHEIQREILQLLNASLSPIKGYSRSTLNKSEGDGTHILAVHMFSMSAEVTSPKVLNTIQKFLNDCSLAMPHCGVPLHHTLRYSVSMEWGRETIEMQENGSTKNLLQMTDIYYSPALRNPELERSGLYPFSGLPGSRHSCIYPAQWNPSFISDDTRRRDYF